MRDSKLERNHITLDKFPVLSSYKRLRENEIKQKLKKKLKNRKK